MEHAVHIGSEAAPALEAWLREHPYSGVAVLTDENTKKHCYPLLKPVLPRHTLITIKSGEAQKNLETCTAIWQKLTDARLDRKGLVLNLGGGVIGDMGGFCAATYKRGIDFVQIPTTLLSQVDASVGGKLGIDFNGYKNHIGVFREPAWVLVATDFLQTLSPRRCVRASPKSSSTASLPTPPCGPPSGAATSNSNAGRNSCRIRCASSRPWWRRTPPRRAGGRCSTSATRWATPWKATSWPTPKRRLLHGEAIAVGMIAEAYLSNQRGLLPEKDLAQVEEFLFAVYGKVNLEAADAEAIAPLALQDKKNQGGKIQCVLLREVGQPVIDQAISLKDIKRRCNTTRDEKLPLRHFSRRTAGHAHHPNLRPKPARFPHASVRPAARPRRRPAGGVAKVRRRK
jgi:3-dehydroquinate synthase